MKLRPKKQINETYEVNKMFGKVKKNSIRVESSLNTFTRKVVMEQIIKCKEIFKDEMEREAKLKRIRNCLDLEDE